jgi:hypothetical protein
MVIASLIYFLGQLLQDRNIKMSTNERAVGSQLDVVFITPLDDGTLLVEGM